MYKPNILFSKINLLLICILLLSTCSSLPKTYLAQQRMSQSERTDFNRKVFDAAWMKVNKKYFDATFNGKDWAMLGEKYRDEAVSAADTGKLYEVINKMLSELEVSHLAAVRTAREDITDSRKKPGAIGIIVDVLKKTLYISTVIPGSPADKAGVQKGWLVIGRNGKKFPDAKTAVLRTIAGEAVTFDFIDQYDQLCSLSIVPVKRSKIKYVKAHELDNGFLYIRMANFERKSVKLLRKKLEEYSHTRGLVFDLRNNPGGNLFYSRVAVGHFFSDNVEMGTFLKRNGGEMGGDSIDFLTLNYDKPMVIMVNQGSGSAAEIFSHILQFHNRATIIGQKTVGAVLAARKYKLPDGGEITVPISDYIGLNGERLEGTGVTPDRELPERSLADIRAGKDKDIEIAVEILNKVK